MPEGDRVRQWYAREFGLPAEQVRYFEELTPAQVEKVRQYFSAGLVGVKDWMYAVKRDEDLVWHRVKRDGLVESRGEW